MLLRALARVLAPCSSVDTGSSTSNHPHICMLLQKTGGVKFSAQVPLTRLGDDPAKTVYSILHEYKIHNAEVLMREDAGVDDLIDVIEGNRKYVRCLYVWNKIDTVTMEDVDRLARKPHSVVISCNAGLNLDRLVDRVWDYLGLTRIYTKKRGQPPDLKEPVVLTYGRHGITVDSLCSQVRALRDIALARHVASDYMRRPTSSLLLHTATHLFLADPPRHQERA